MKKTIFAIIIIIIFFIIFLPQILSITIGKSLVAAALQTKLHAKTTVGSVNFSWIGPQTIENVVFSNDQMVGSVESIQSNAMIWDLKNSPAFVMKNCNVTFGDVTLGPFDAKVENTQVNAAGNTSLGGHFSVRGKFVSKDDFDLAIDCTKMPSSAIDSLIQGNGYFAAAVGSTFDLAAKIASSGILADLISPNAKVSLQGEINEDLFHFKTLGAAMLQFSPALRDKLQGVIVEAKNPIRLQVDAAEIALKTFAINSANGSLDVGQLVIADLHPLLSLLALLRNGRAASNNATVWFTKANLSMDHEVLKIGRVDALIANAVHLCGWGNLNLQSNQLDMIFGIPKETLSSSLGIQNLPKDFVIQIPVKGTLQSPQIDTGSAGVKIAALIASQQITKKAGPLHGLIQNKAIPMQEKKAPPPNKPFPWNS